ncbi:MAG: hypothetical protein P4L35_15860 [Ignavibacteriaceae bacterium]|nr:hypothetical protein [Ignavibacteriaceae bacterium]
MGLNKKNFFVARNISLLKCPSCQKVGTLHKSKTRNFKESVFKNLFFKGYYRCWDCNWRGRKFRKAVTKQSFKVLGFYILLAIITALLVLLVIKNMAG